MEQYTLELVEWINTLPSASIYAVFFLIAYLENVAPPIPGDLLVAFGGYLAAEEVVGIGPVLILTTVASVIGFMTMYWLGSHWGTRIQQRHKDFWLIRFIDFKYYDKVRRWMQRWGQGVIVANRFLAGTRSVISLTAGITHTHVGYTVLSSTVSSLLWNSILLAFGWVLHENWQQVGEYLSLYGRAILVGIVLFILIRLGISYFRKKKKSRNSSCKG